MDDFEVLNYRINYVNEKLESRRDSSNIPDSRFSHATDAQQLESQQGPQTGFNDRAFHAELSTFLTGSALPESFRPTDQYARLHASLDRLSRNNLERYPRSDLQHINNTIGRYNYNSTTFREGDLSSLASGVEALNDSALRAELSTNLRTFLTGSALPESFRPTDQYARLHASLGRLSRNNLERYPRSDLQHINNTIGRYNYNSTTFREGDLSSLASGVEALNHSAFRAELSTFLTGSALPESFRPTIQYVRLRASLDRLSRNNLERYPHSDLQHISNNISQYNNFTTFSENDLSSLASDVEALNRQFSHAPDGSQQGSRNLGESSSRGG